MGKDIFSLLGKTSRVSKHPHSTLLKKNKSPLKNDKDDENMSCNIDAWQIVGTHLAYRTPHTPPLHMDSPIKIAAFDLDGTLTKTKSGRQFPLGPHDWKWLTESTESKLSDYQEDGYLIVIFTNQGGMIARKEQKSFNNFVTKMDYVLRDFNDVFVFVSPKRPSSNSAAVKANSGMAADISTVEQHDRYRKPNTGMWQELVNLLSSIKKEDRIEIDMTRSFYCGDAAGRPGDFSDSDKQFAANIGIKFYTPEELLH